MRQAVFLIYSDDTKFVADEICENMFINRKFYSATNTLTAGTLLDMASYCRGEYFYIIKTDINILFPNFDFSYTIPEWDKEYLHIWNNDTSVRLLNVKSVLIDANKYSDINLSQGLVDIKNINERIIAYPIFDIVFLSYDEPNADENYKILKSRFPRAKHIHGVKGILEAHRAAAKLVTSPMFYVVDADAEIASTFNFDYNPHSIDRQSVHVWNSINPVNDLKYGYGGVKLFPTNLLINYNGSPVDFSTTVSENFKVIEEISNVTKFNTDPFSAWRSGFRETVKLASNSIPNQVNEETAERLHIWTTKGAEQDFGEFTLMGAIAGEEYGRLHKDQPNMLGLINDFSWLENKFSNTDQDISQPKY